jgi:hypothetical protein
VPLSRNLGTLTSWNPLGHSRPVTGLLYLNFLERSGPLQASNGTILPLPFNNNKLSASTTCFDLHVSSSGKCKWNVVLGSLLNVYTAIGDVVSLLDIVACLVDVFLNFWFVLGCIEVPRHSKLGQNTNPPELTLKSNYNPAQKPHGQVNSVYIATDYGLEGPRIESRWG